MVAAMLLAVQTAIASASMTIKWNTRTTAPAHPSMPQGRSIPHDDVQYGVLTAIKNRTVSVRLADGSVRTFVATNDEVNALRALVGTRIAFRVTP